MRQKLLRNQQEGIPNRRKEITDTPINRIEMTPAMFPDSSSGTDLSASTLIASSSQGATSLNLELSLFNKGVRSSGIHSPSLLARFKVRVELVIAIEAERRWRLQTRDGVIEDAGALPFSQTLYILLQHNLKFLCSPKTCGSPLSIHFLQKAHSMLRNNISRPSNQRKLLEVPSAKGLSPLGGASSTFSAPPRLQGRKI